MESFPAIPRPNHCGGTQASPGECSAQSHAARQWLHSGQARFARLGFRQTVIRGYSRLLNAARPFVNAMNVVLGRPRVPEVGEVLAQAFLSPLAFVEGAEAILPDFIAASFSHARRMGVEFLAIALPQEDAGLSVVHRRFSTRSWRSRLYSVDWPERRALPMRGTAFLPDVSLL